jgi:hypothetical protein
MNNTQTTGKKFFPTTHRAEVNSYPYGRLKATAFFGLEFKRGKGFRTTFQTINPKNGKLNAIKNSTYSPIFVMYEEQETGHIKYLSFDLYGEEGINKAAEFMRDNYDLFTAEQIQDICGSMFVHLKAGAKAICVYCGADFEKVKPILDPAVTAVAEGIKTGANIFDRVKIDIEALNSCKVEGYQPFKVTTYQMA